VVNRSETCTVQCNMLITEPEVTEIYPLKTGFISYRYSKLEQSGV